MRLIDADKLNLLLGISDRDIYAKYMLDKMPTVDAVPVVRCLECKWYEKSVGLCNWCSSDITRNFRDEDDFCSYGERKECDD